MKIVSIGCTHTAHDVIDIPKCDILIHTGDYTQRGSRIDTEMFLSWFTSQDQARHKILVPGNHDIQHDPAFNKETYANSWLQGSLEQYGVGEDFHLLINESIEIEKLNIWGSPITPSFYREYWAFNADRGEEIRKYWDMIPTNADIIITHGPAYRIHDLIPSQNKHVGCQDLLERISEIAPSLHVCSHIHEGRGIEEIDETIYINASIMNERYIPTYKPIIIKL